LLGYPEQARRRSQEALGLAHELRHPFSLGYALFFTAWLQLFCGEGGGAQERAEALRALASEHGVAHYWAQGTIQRGGALIAQGRWAEGVAAAREGREGVGGDVMGPPHLGVLGGGGGGGGQGEEGVVAVGEALRLVDKNDERLYEAELYRLKGELTLAQSSAQGLASAIRNPQSAIGNPQLEAEVCFHKAIGIARRQQAKSLELRA